MALSDFQTLASNLVRDDAAKIDVGDRDIAVALAVIRYSTDRPRIAVVDLVSPGGHYLDLPAGWSDGFSVIRSLEYPIGSVPPTLIESEGWDMYQAPAGIQVALTSVLSVGVSVRATFTLPHTLDAVTDTIPLRDREAVCCWAAAQLCDQLASLYSGDSDSTIQADTVNHGGKAREFAARAKTLRARYQNELGVEDKRDAPASAVVNLNRTDSLGGDRLMHPRRYR